MARAASRWRGFAFGALSDCHGVAMARGLRFFFASAVTERSRRSGGAFGYVAFVGYFLPIAQSVKTSFCGAAIKGKACFPGYFFAKKQTWAETWAEKQNAPEGAYLLNDWRRGCPPLLIPASSKYSLHSLLIYSIYSNTSSSTFHCFPLKSGIQSWAGTWAERYGQKHGQAHTKPAFGKDGR